MIELSKELRKDFDDRRVVLFLGAGASMPSDGRRGFPSAAELAEIVCAELLDKAVATTPNLAEAAQRAIWMCGSRGPLESLLTRVFCDPAVTPHAHHTALSYLSFPIITTNYDLLIEQAFRSSGVHLSVVRQDSDIPSINDPYLLKIHGCIGNPSTCIVSDDDYYKWLSNESELKNLVRSLFTSLRVIFLGYSLADINFRMLLGELRRKIGPSLRRPLIVAHRIDTNSYNYAFATNSLGARFIEASVADFIATLSELYVHRSIPYADKYREDYFSRGGLLAQPFVDYAAERLLAELRSSTAGRIQLDQDIVNRVFRIASRKCKELYNDIAPVVVPPGMVYIPPGEFIMGGSRLGNELIRVERIDKGFLIQEATVSNREYRSFVEYIKKTGDHSKCHPNEPPNKDHWPDTDFSGAAAGDVIVVPLPSEYFTNPQFDDYPAVNIDWWDAYAFAAWKGWRLPTEMEWEKAARGIDGRLFPYGNTFDPQCSNVAETGIHQPVRIRNYPQGRSPYGCFEMSGNVWEWCNDVFSPEDQKSPVSRVVRGGSCTRGKVKAGVNFRHGRHPEDRWVARGFRCVMDCSQTAKTTA